MEWLNIALDVLLSVVMMVYYFLECQIRRLLPVKWIAKDISNDVVLITGAGSGLGRLTAKRIAKLCYSVVAWDINQEANEETVEQIRAAGGKAFAYQCDVSNREDVYRVAKQVKKDVGPVTIIINNAGIVSGHHLLDTPDESIQKTFDVNVLAHFWITKFFLPDMMEKNHGHIVTIASVAGYYGTNRLVDYCASKFAAVGFDDALRTELSVKGYNGIHQTCICPFYINTGMFDGVRSVFLPVLDQEFVSKQIVNAILINDENVFLPRHIYIVTLLKMLLPRKSLNILDAMVGNNKLMANFVGRQSSSKANDNNAKAESKILDD